MLLRQRTMDLITKICSNYTMTPAQRKVCSHKKTLKMSQNLLRLRQTRTLSLSKFTWKVKRENSSRTSLCKKTWSLKNSASNLTSTANGSSNYQDWLLLQRRRSFSQWRWWSKTNTSSWRLPMLSIKSKMLPIFLLTIKRAASWRITSTNTNLTRTKPRERRLCASSERLVQVRQKSWTPWSITAWESRSTTTCAIDWLMSPIAKERVGASSTKFRKLYVIPRCLWLILPDSVTKGVRSKTDRSLSKWSRSSWTEKRSIRYALSWSQAPLDCHPNKNTFCSKLLGYSAKKLLQQFLSWAHLLTQILLFNKLWMLQSPSSLSMTILASSHPSLSTS